MQSEPLFYDTTWGIDVRDMLNESIDSRTLAQWKSKIERQARKEEEIESARATIVVVSSKQIEIELIG